MFNKLVAAGAGVGMLLAVATPAFAYEWHRSSSGLTIRNTADITNVITTNSNTGYNGITGSGSLRGRHDHHTVVGVSDSAILTGNAVSGAEVVNTVNSVNLDTCGCRSQRTVRITNNADLSNIVTTNSNTGYNGITGGSVVNSGIDTGNSEAGTGVLNFINSFGSVLE